MMTRSALFCFGDDIFRTDPNDKGIDKSGESGLGSVSWTENLCDKGDISADLKGNELGREAMSRLLSDRFVQKFVSEVWAKSVFCASSTRLKIPAAREDDRLNKCMGFY